jgi:hypothetical protein
VLCFDIFSGAVVCEDQQSEQVATEEKRIAAEENAYRLERRLALLQKERDSLKSLLDSYSAEVRWKGGVLFGYCSRAPADLPLLVMGLSRNGPLRNTSSPPVATKPCTQRKTNESRT